MMKRLYTYLAAGLCALAIAGCGPAEPTTPAGDADKVLTVGTDPTFPPFEYYQEQTGSYTGFDLDLIQEIAAEMGYDRVEFVNTPFADLLTGLNDHQYDAVIACMSITDSRKEVAAFTEPYAVSEYVVVLPKRNSPVTREELAHMKISVRANSEAERIARSLSDNLDPCPTIDDVLLRVTSGASDAFVADLYGARFLIANGYGDQVVLSDLDISDDSQLAIAVRKDDEELLRQLNEGLDTFRKSTRYSQLVTNYFGH